MTYVLAKKQSDAMLFACGNDPRSVNTAVSIDRAKQFESPDDALEFRAGMEPRWQNVLIVHEFDGSLLHSLDV